MKNSDTQQGTEEEKNRCNSKRQNLTTNEEISNFTDRKLRI